MAGQCNVEHRGHCRGHGGPGWRQASSATSGYEGELPPPLFMLWGIPKWLKGPCPRVFLLPRRYGKPGPLQGKPDRWSRCLKSTISDGRIRMGNTLSTWSNSVFFNLWVETQQGNEALLQGSQQTFKACAREEYILMIALSYQNRVLDTALLLLSVLTSTTHQTLGPASVWEGQHNSLNRLYSFGRHVLWHTHQSPLPLVAGASDLHQHNWPVWITWQVKQLLLCTQYEYICE